MSKEQAALRLVITALRTIKEMLDNDVPIPAIKTFVDSNIKVLSREVGHEGPY